MLPCRSSACQQTQHEFRQRRTASEHMRAAGEGHAQHARGAASSHAGHIANTPRSLRRSPSRVGALGRGWCGNELGESVLAPPRARCPCLPVSPILSPRRAGSGKHTTAMGTVYLPKLGSELAQFSFLSSRASRRQKVRLQGQPEIGAMPGRKETETLNADHNRKGAVLSQLSAMNLL